MDQCKVLKLNAAQQVSQASERRNCRDVVRRQLQGLVLPRPELTFIFFSPGIDGLTLGRAGHLGVLRGLSLLLASL